MMRLNEWHKNFKWRVFRRLDGELRALSHGLLVWAAENAWEALTTWWWERPYKRCPCCRRAWTSHQYSYCDECADLLGYG